VDPFFLLTKLFKHSNDVFSMRNKFNRRFSMGIHQSYSHISVALEILEDRTLLDASNPDVTLSSDVTEITEYWKIPTFTATLSEIAVQDVIVNLEFSGSATKGDDYGAWQSNIFIAAGDLTGQVQIQSIPDNLIEGDETIVVDVTSIINGNEATEQTVTLTLKDDDTPPPSAGPFPDVTLSSDVTEIDEYWKVPTFTATLSEVTTHDVIAILEFSGTATTGDDYGAWQSYIRISEGDLTGQVQIQSIPDNLIEGDETIVVDVTSVVNGNESGIQTVTVTLTDDDTPPLSGGPVPDVTLSSDVTEIDEYWKVPTFTATLSEITTHDVIAILEFSGTATTGKDYGAWQSYITIKEGDLTGQVQIQSIPDDLIEGDETIVVDITSVVNGNESGEQTVTLTLTDDDIPPSSGGPVPDVTLSSDMTEIDEYWKVPTFTATLSEVTTHDIVVNLGFSGTATKGDDYGAWQTYILIEEGNLTGQVQIQSIPDNLIEGNETIVVDITSVINGNESGIQTVTVTLTDDDTPVPDDVIIPLTIITHGGLLDEFPPWVYDMANAVNVRANYGYNNTQIQNSRASSPDDPYNGTESLLLFDWISNSSTLGIADNDEVAGQLAALIEQRINALEDNEKLDLHFVGHSRGTYVNDSAIERIAGYSDQIRFLQMTTLDNQPYGSDGTLTSNPGGIVDFHDNYYQRDDFFVNGDPIDGAFNINLTQIVQGWDGRASHSEVHDWYHWSIDLTDDGLPALESGSEVPILNDATRTQIFNASSATMGDGGIVDFDPIDGNVDDWDKGSQIGYYYSLVGGGLTVDSIPSVNSLVASGIASVTDNSPPLTNEDLQPVLDEAISRLSTTIDPLYFENIQISIADLNGQLLGQEQNGAIIIDVDAAGFGWFIDSTPEDDSEFRYNSKTNQFEAVSENAVGRMDLLSVLMHELGHAVGLEHDDSSEGFMNSQLEAGTRSVEFVEVDSFFSNESELASVLNT
jgi:Matrixin/Calx-beta domain